MGEIKEYFMICENYMKPKPQWPNIKFYENIATFIHLQIVYSCFWVTTGGLSSWDKDHKMKKKKKKKTIIWPSKPNVLTIWPFVRITLLTLSPRGEVSTYVLLFGWYSRARDYRGEVASKEGSLSLLLTPKPAKTSLVLSDLLFICFGL